MKKVMNKYRMMAIAAATIFTLGISNATFANSGPKESPSELKYLGSFTNLPVFQLNLNNTEVNSYVITIKDSYNNILYTEKVKGINISRRYKLSAEEVDLIGGTTFEVFNKKTNSQFILFP